MEATKKDQGKLQFTLVPQVPFQEVMRVFMFGAEKYGRDNYLVGKGLDIRRLIDATVRHTMAYCEGERNDPESGLHHMAHVAANALMIQAIERKRRLFLVDEPERILCEKKSDLGYEPEFP